MIFPHNLQESGSVYRSTRRPGVGGDTSSRGTVPLASAKVSLIEGFQHELTVA